MTGDTKPLIPCVDCGKRFDPCDSLMGDEGQCQDCWEAYCDRAYWRMHNALATARLERVRGLLATRAMKRANPQLYRGRR